MKRQTAKWIRKAEDDLIGARRLEQDKPPLYDLACFHCQQSAEKYLKALLQELGIVPPRTYELETLLTLLLPQNATLKILRRKLESLTRYAVDIRYPDARATKKQAQAALRHTEAVRREIRARLGLTS